MEYQEGANGRELSRNRGLKALGGEGLGDGPSLCLGKS